MFIDTDFPPGDGRLAQFMRLVEAFERDEIEAGVDLLIEALDKRDGDPDLEDDDPAGGAIDDQPHDPEEDFGAEEQGEAGSWPEGWQGGTPFPDDDGEEDRADQIARRPFRDRVRRTRCTSSEWRSPYDGKLFTDYRLRDYRRPPIITAAELIR